MSSYQIHTEAVSAIAVIHCKGYINDLAGAAINQAVEDLIAKGQTKAILDFSECVVINSLGIAALMTLAIRFTDDFQGRLFFSGLDDFKCQVLGVAGILQLVEIAKDVPAAVEAFS